MRRNKAISLHSSRNGQLEQQQQRDAQIASIWRATSLRLRRKNGPPTPAPSWKLYENPFYEGMMQIGASQQAGGISARRLAASLWELQEVPLCKTPPRDSSCFRLRSEPPRRPAAAAARKKLLLLPGTLNSASGASSSRRGAKLKPTDASRTAAQTSRQLVAMQAHINRLLDKSSKKHYSEIDTHKKSLTGTHTNIDEDDTRKPSSRKADSNTEVDSRKHDTRVANGHSEIDTKRRDVNDRQTRDESSGYLLQRIDSLEEQNASTSGLTTAMKAEVRLARHKVKELEAANRLARKEVDSLLKRIAEDKAVSSDREQERMKQALRPIKEEIDEARKLRRKMELAHRKLIRELGDAKMGLSKALEDRDRERKARTLMEQTCDELAKEIGQDKAEVEQLKHETVKLKQELEEERRMLQVAEVWREERVQMKLIAAKEELEHKVTALEALKSRLHDFLKLRRRVLDNGDYANQQADIRDAERLESAAESLLLACRRCAAGAGEDSSSLAD